MNSLTQQTKWTRNHSNVFGMCQTSFLELLEAEILKCQHLDIFHHASCKNESLWKLSFSMWALQRDFRWCHVTAWDPFDWRNGSQLSIVAKLDWWKQWSDGTPSQNVHMKKKNTKKIVRAISPIFFPGLQLPCVHELYFTSPYCNHWHTHDTIKRSAGIFSCSFEYLMDAKGAQLVQMVRQSLDGWAKPSKHSREPR